MYPFQLYLKEANNSKTKASTSKTVKPASRKSLDGKDFRQEGKKGEKKGSEIISEAAGLL